MSERLQMGKSENREDTYLRLTLTGMYYLCMYVVERIFIV